MSDLIGEAVNGISRFFSGAAADPVAAGVDGAALGGTLGVAGGALGGGAGLAGALLGACVGAGGAGVGADAGLAGAGVGVDAGVLGAALPLMPLQLLGSMIGAGPEQCLNRCDACATPGLPAEQAFGGSAQLANMQSAVIYSLQMSAMMEASPLQAGVAGGMLGLLGPALPFLL